MFIIGLKSFADFFNRQRMRIAASHYRGFLTRRKEICYKKEQPLIPNS
jgi:hypothetical protein